MKVFAPLHRETFGRLAVEVHRDPRQLGRAAAWACAAQLRTSLAGRGHARVLVAGDASQEELFAELANPAGAGGAIDWSRVTVFQLYEHAGPRLAALYTCRHYLQERLLDRAAIGCFHGLEAGDSDGAVCCDRYAALLEEQPIDLACLGLGADGGLAGNAPAAANFEDEQGVRCVKIDAASRRRQVHDPECATPVAVPHMILTVTLPVLRRARRLSVLASGARLAPAVRATLHDAITTACPATLLRLHPDAVLYLDAAAAALAFPGLEPGSRRRRVLRP